jgi:acetyl esterase/lipase
MSPVYGDFHGFPPTVLTTGTRDLFLSNTVRVYRKLREVGVEAMLNVFEGQSHAQYFGQPLRSRNQGSPRRDRAVLRRASRQMSQSFRTACRDGPIFIREIRVEAAPTNDAFPPF